MWAKMAAAACGGDTPFHAAKRDVAGYFATRMLPQVEGLARQIKAGPEPMLGLAVEGF